MEIFVLMVDAESPDFSIIGSYRTIEKAQEAAEAAAYGDDEDTLKWERQSPNTWTACDEEETTSFTIYRTTLED